MNSKIENITPEIAAKYLEKNIHNRPIKPSAIRRYALQMKAKQWLISHQGIAFDTEGNLFDGQNRLLAIKEA